MYMAVSAAPSFQGRIGGGGKAKNWCLRSVPWWFLTLQKYMARGLGPPHLRGRQGTRLRVQLSPLGFAASSARAFWASTRARISECCLVSFSRLRSSLRSSDRRVKK